jgi:hypothetical protein
VHGRRLVVGSSHSREGLGLSRIAADCVVLRQNAVRRQVVDLSPLIRRRSQLDDQPSAPPPSALPVPLRRPPPARSREPSLAPPARRVQEDSATAQASPDGSALLGRAGQGLDRVAERSDGRTRRSAGCQNCGRRSDSHSQKHPAWRCRGFLPPAREIPSMTNSCFVTMVPQASHVSPLPGPPQTFGKLSSGNLPSASLLKIRRRRASGSMDCRFCQFAPGRLLDLSRTAWLRLRPGCSGRRDDQRGFCRL